MGTSRYLHQLGEEVHALQTEASIGHPLALVTVGSDTGEIVWYNRKARTAARRQQYCFSSTDA